VNGVNRSVAATPPPGGFLSASSTDRDAVLGGLVLTVFLHLLLFWAVPQEVFLPRPYSDLYPQAVEVTLAPVLVDNSDQQYVRATPDVPEERPEQTENTSDRDQVAAQEQVVPPSPDNSPYNEGDMEDSNRLVQGDPTQQSTPAPTAATASTGSSPMVQQIPAPAQRPAVQAPDVPELESEQDEGMAVVTTPAQALEMPEELPEQQADLNIEETSTSDGTGRDQIFTPPQSPDQTVAPRPRPRLSERDTSYGPLRDNRAGGAGRIGRLAWDAQYSEFGKHWTEVAEVIEKRWRSLLYGRRSVPFDGSYVQIQFYLTREGYIEDLQIVQSTAGRVPEQVASDAILGPQPFKKFTPDMIATIGERSLYQIRFFY